MFRVLFILGFVFFSSLFSQTVNWEKDFHSGVENATLKNKPILFVFSSHNCYYCKVLDETTFKDEDVIQKLNKEFISIISYTDEDDYTPKELWRPGTPTLWFLNPNGEARYEPLMGAIAADSFLKALDIVKKDFDERQKDVK